MIGVVLAVETTLDACSVAVASTRGDLKAQMSEVMSRGQAERIAPMTREVMAQAKASFADIGRIVVTSGPGSFTGVRVGLSFARALSLALGQPCLGVSTLEALALQDGAEGLRGAVIETPGAAYAALYRDGVAVAPPCSIERGSQTALFRKIAPTGEIRVAGPGLGVSIGALAARGASLDPAQYRPEPMYLRAPHVTVPDFA